MFLIEGGDKKLLISRLWLIETITSLRFINRNLWSEY